MYGAQPPAIRWALPVGATGTQLTLDAMRRVARTASRVPAVRRMAVELFRDAGGGPARWIALRAFLARHWRFARDPRTQETLYTPATQLRHFTRTGEFVGDCDDAATLSAALAVAGGMPARFVALAFDGEGFRHVFTEVRVNDEWREVDITRTRQTLPRRVTRVWALEV